MTQLSSSSDLRLPRYQQIRDDIAARIAAGEWKAGSCIASESELSAKYEVAVGTVRRAIDRLENDGLIERVQGKGMFVRRADLSNSLFRFFRLNAGTSRIRPLSRIISRELTAPTAEARRELGLDARHKAIRLLRLRLDAEGPLLREEIWVPAKLFEGLHLVDVEELQPLLYPAYERLYGRVVAKARERLSFEVAGDQVAEDLQTVGGDPVVRIERLALDHAGQPLEWRVSHGPAGRFVYEAEIT